MKTQIVIEKGWKILFTHQSLFTMSKGDIVEFEYSQYEVLNSYFDISENKMIILLK